MEIDIMKFVDKCAEDAKTAAKEKILMRIRHDSEIIEKDKVIQELRAQIENLKKTPETEE